MPSCTSESLSRAWPSNESIHAGGTSSTSNSQSPTSPNSFSPISTSPDSTLRRRRIRRTSSLGSVIQEPFVIHSDARDSRSQSPVLTVQDDSFSSLSELIGWYPCFLLRIVNAVLLDSLPNSWTQIVFAVPMLWISFWFWCFKQVLQLPLVIFKILLVDRGRAKRTVLISGGSTIQALHLARNLYSAGARVVVCEVDGLFPLARFSMAVSKFYKVPRPTSDQQQNYVRALCEIVDKEEAVYYIPVSATTSAYYDAVAKPHLELLGCTCFCPGIKEVWVLDDTLEVLKRCHKYNIPTPIYHAVTSRDDIDKLYDTGAVRRGIFVMSTAGPSGLRERSKITLPLSKADLKIPSDISEQRPWVIVQDVVGEHYLTCTTVKESQVIANVTCKMDSSGALIPVENKDVNMWLSNFFNKLNLLRPITGHVSFRFVAKDSIVMPLSSRVGVSLPYICYTNVHPRLLWKPCKHFRRQNSGLSENGFREGVAEVTRLLGTVLDKREALFALWDPLPYCAYYHMQLPFKNVLGFMQRRRERLPRPGLVR